MKPRYSTTVLWGAIGEIGLRKAIYGSRDASWLKKHMAGSCCLVVPILLTSFIQTSKLDDCCDAEEETISSQRIRFIGYQIDDYNIQGCWDLVSRSRTAIFFPFRSWLGTEVSAQLAHTIPRSLPSLTWVRSWSAQQTLHSWKRPSVWILRPGTLWAPWPFLAFFGLVRISKDTLHMSFVIIILNMIKYVYIGDGILTVKIHFNPFFLNGFCAQRAEPVPCPNTTWCDVLGLAYLDNTWQDSLAGRGATTGLQGRKTFVDNWVTRRASRHGLLGIHVRKTRIKVIDATAANITSEQYLSHLEKRMVQLLSD